MKQRHTTHHPIDPSLVLQHAVPGRLGLRMPMIRRHEPMRERLQQMLAGTGPRSG